MLMCFLSYMEYSLFVFFTCCNVCVGSCLVLWLLCLFGYDWFYSFVFSCAIAKRELYSYVCCSMINFPDRWYSCIYIFAPNSSCDFLYCIVLIVLMLFLLVQIHVYSVLYGLHMLIVDYSFFVYCPTVIRCQCNINNIPWFPSILIGWFVIPFKSFFLN